MMGAGNYSGRARRILLAPIGWSWGLILRVRHALFDRGILKSHRPAVPTIVVGNLSFGGTGKTPHVELVLESLRDLSPLATLSRGYGRSGRELREVMPGDRAIDVGDEPLMLKRAHPGINVFVGADRVNALQGIRQAVPGVKAVVLDDAFQHRRLDAGLNILLTTWGRPWSDDALVPAGTLRDLKARARTAQVVIVSKCPLPPSAGEQARWRDRLRLGTEQHLFFSAIEHGTPAFIHAAHGEVPIGRDAAALLVTGIADPGPLLEHARKTWGMVGHVAFPDHHPFSPADIGRLAGVFATFARPPKTIITTAKDAVRLLPLIPGSALENDPIAVVPVKAGILNEPDGFAALLRQHVAAHPPRG